MLIQTLVSDVLGIKSGHRAGAPIEYNPDSAYFRAARALANTNEGVAVFVLLALYGIFSEANPVWVNYLSVVYMLGRLGHMFAYYADLPRTRSSFFGLASLALVGLAIAVWL